MCPSSCLSPAIVIVVAVVYEALTRFQATYAMLSVHYLTQSSQLHEVSTAILRVLEGRESKA